MKPSRVMVTTIWPGSIRLSSSWSASASMMSVSRGEAISLRAAVSSSRITSMRRMREPRMSSSSRIFAADLGHLGVDLLALQPGQPLQPQFQDAARLLLGQPHGALGRDRRCPARRSARATAPTSAAGQSRSIKATRAAAASGLARIRRITSSILATAIARPTRLCARSRALLQFEPGAAEDHLLAEADEAHAARPSAPSAAAGRCPAPAC